jgi:hypothetical protein
LAAAFYLLVALWAMRVVLPAPHTLLPVPTSTKAILDSLHLENWDQQIVVAGIARNARDMLRAPWALLDNGQCFPMTRSITLGEHMYGVGLLGVIPALVTGDPIATYNAVIVLTLWIPALTMYALVRYWTGSTAAALVAGFLFAFQPSRIGNPEHPFVHGDLWTPLVLLFSTRLFHEGTWSSAAGLAVALGLQLLESLYPLIALAAIGAIYGPYLLLRFWRVLPRRLPQILAVTTVVVAVAVLILGPYMRAQTVWGIFEGHGSFLMPAHDFLPGHVSYPGTVMSVLALVAVGDRIRGPRRAHGYDPRLVMLAAGLLVFSLVIWGVTIPGIGFLRSPYGWLIGRFPGLGAVRAVAAARSGVYLTLAFLAGYGMLALTASRSRRVRLAITAGLLALASVEVFSKPLGDLLLGVTPVAMEARAAAPPAPLVGALKTLLPPGAVLDLPVGPLRRSAHPIFLAAYHEHPVAACYNSWSERVPVVADVGGLAARLPEPRALVALRAAGFGSIVIHGELLSPGDRAEIRKKFWTAASAEAGPVRLLPVGEYARHLLYRLVGEVDPEQSFAPLAGGAAAGDVQVPTDGQLIAFRFRNAGTRAYRHPDPIEPTLLVARWTRESDGMVTERETRTLLPLALAPGEETLREVQVAMPDEAGRYHVTLAAARAPDVVLAQANVELPDVDGGGEAD